MCPPVCLSVCLSVCLYVCDWTKIQKNKKSYLRKFNFIGQRSRPPGKKCHGHGEGLHWSRSKVIKVKVKINVTLVTWRHGTTSWRHVMSQDDVMTSWHPLTTYGPEYWQRRHVAGGRVNAQVFSLADGLTLSSCIFMIMLHKITVNQLNSAAVKFLGFSPFWVIIGDFPCIILFNWYATAKFAKLRDCSQSWKRKYLTYRSWTPPPPQKETFEKLGIHWF